MNNVIKLSGKPFIQASRQGGGGGVSMNGQKSVTYKHIQKVKKDIEQLILFWNSERRPFTGALVSVRYNKIVAKSNRISGLLKGRATSSAVVGAKYNENKTAHIITYYVDIEDLEKSVALLKATGDIVRTVYDGCVDKHKFSDKAYCSHVDQYKSIRNSTFRQVIADISYIDGLEVPNETVATKSNGPNSIVSLYDVHMDITTLLNKIGIENVFGSRVVGSNTVSLTTDQLRILQKSAPYLISMSVDDEEQLSLDEHSVYNNGYEDATSRYIPRPKDEPIIGVIDKLFDNRVYFSDWVENHDMVDESIPRSIEDYVHGTGVSSIIVDGPSLNPQFDDGCGRFRVRHFGVATGRRFSSSMVMQQVEKIILANKDIKVWNFSLGSELEISDNFVSFEAAVLDRLQYENDIIFVVSGTNDTACRHRKIGSPADSINSLVVNAVELNNKPAEYGRTGPALSFYVKPDVSYYGYFDVCRPNAIVRCEGTSYAAPWIARKLSYLIDVLKLSREVAKAMIIDAARGWSVDGNLNTLIQCGYGVVPIHINDIVYSSDGEIKFIVSDKSIKWNTYEYHFPVPMRDDRYPYVARATMCYFPLCTRSQGVDYTNTELNIHFGRIDDNNRIKDIKGDKQNQDGVNGVYIYEDEARKNFRKWDNVKICTEQFGEHTRPRKSYKYKNWGMEIKTTNRVNYADGRDIRFGVVVTLKEIRGINRFDEFVRNCILNGWLVNRINISSQIEINEKVNENIELE